MVAAVAGTVGSVVSGKLTIVTSFWWGINFSQGTVSTVADVAYNTIVTAENIGLGAAHMAVDAGKFATGWAVGMHSSSLSSQPLFTHKSYRDYRSRCWRHSSGCIQCYRDRPAPCSRCD